MAVDSLPQGPDAAVENTAVVAAANAVAAVVGMAAIIGPAVVPTTSPMSRPLPLGCCW